MSRLHAVFQLREGRWWIADNGSTHGTRRNGAQVDKAPQALVDGDRIELGPNHVFVLHAAPPERPS